SFNLTSGGGATFAGSFSCTTTTGGKCTAGTETFSSPPSFLPGQTRAFTGEIQFNASTANGAIFVLSLAPGNITPDAATPALPNGNTIIKTLVAAPVAVGIGRANFATNEGSGGQKVPALQFTLSASADASVTQLKFQVSQN